MVLLAPTIGGPLSRCSTRVGVSGVVSGARIEILVNGQSKNTSDPIGGSRAVVEIGATLSAGDKVTARQHFQSDVSDPSPLPSIVQPLPPALSDLNLRAPLIACGRRISFDGGLPGAEIEVSDGNTLFDTIDYLYGTAWARVPPMTQGVSLHLMQTSCNMLTHTTVTPPAMPLPSSISQPQIMGPLVECMTSVQLDNIVPGATVIMWRDGEESARFDCAETATTWWGHKPFKVGEEVTIRQSFTCATDVEEPDILSERETRMVSKASSMSKPVIFQPICPGDTHVTIANLTPGARVLFMIDNQPLGYTETPSVTHSFPLQGLKAGQKLTVQCELCGKVSPVSEPAEPQSDTAISSLTVSKLYECASHLFLRSGTGLNEGKIVQVHANGGPISQPVQVYNTYALIQLSPALQAGQKVVISALGCGGATEQFGEYTVAPLDDMLPPDIVQPVEAGQQKIEVDSAYAGAHIALFRDGVYETAAISRGDAMATPMIAWADWLNVGEKMTATHMLCTQLSQPSAPATVVMPKPYPPKLDKPEAGATGLGVSGVQFSWFDMAKGTLAEATDFSLFIREENGPSVGTFQTGGTSLSLGTTLQHSTTHRWEVTAKNSAGTAKSPSRTFTTEAAPKPPPQQNALLAFLSSVYATYDLVNNLWPVPAGQQFKIAIGVGNIGNANAPEAQVVFNIEHGGNHLGTETVTIPAGKQPGWSDYAFWTVGPFGTGFHLFEAALVINNQIVDYTWSEFDLQ